MGRFYWSLKMRTVMSMNYFLFSCDSLLLFFPKCFVSDLFSVYVHAIVFLGPFGLFAVSILRRRLRFTFINVDGDWIALLFRRFRCCFLLTFCVMHLRCLRSTVLGSRFVFFHCYVSQWQLLIVGCSSFECWR